MKSSWNPSVSNSQSEFFCVPILSVCFVKTSLGFHFTFLTGLLGLNPCANTHWYLIIYQPHENYYINLFVKFICSLILKKKCLLIFFKHYFKMKLRWFFLSRSDILSYVWERFFPKYRKDNSKRVKHKAMTGYYVFEIVLISFSPFLSLFWLLILSTKSAFVKNTNAFNNTCCAKIMK